MRQVLATGTVRRAVCSLVALATLTAALGVSATPTLADDRTAITLSQAERDHLLAGMRTYLSSLADITESLSKYDPAAVSRAAKRSGAKMLVDIPPTVALKLPVEFTALSLATHDQFDQLAARAEAHVARTELLGHLAAIMGHCNGCHAAWRVVVAP